MSRYVTAHDQFHQAFPHVSTATDKRWSERPEYETTFVEKAPLPSFQFSSNLNSLAPKKNYIFYLANSNSSLCEALVTDGIVPMAMARYC